MCVRQQSLSLFLCSPPAQDMSSTCAQCDVEWIKKVGDEQ